VKYRLSVHSFRKGCEGSIGDVIDVSGADADYLDSHGAGKRLEVAVDAAAESALEEAKQKPAAPATEKAESKGHKSAEKRG
jgi:hypothetical protein